MAEANYEIRVPVLGERRDMPDNEIPLEALRLCQNMLRSKRGTLDLRPGYVQLGSNSPGSRIMGMAYFKKEDGTEKFVAATTTGWWKFTSTWADISGAALTGTSSDIVKFEPFIVSGVVKLIGVNGKDSPKIWNGTDATYANLGGSPPVALDVASAANRVLLLANPDNIRVSEFNDPETWPTTGGHNVRLPDSGDVKVGMANMNRTSVGIFGEKSQWIARAQGGDAPFRFERISGEIGPVSRGAIVNVSGVLYYLADDGSVYSFNGYETKDVGRAMASWVQDTLDFNNRRMAHGVYLTRYGKIFYFFPSVGSDTVIDRGVFFDPLTGEMGRLKYGNITASSLWKFVPALTWTPGLDSFTWDNIATTYSTWNSMVLGSRMTQVLGDSTGKVYYISESSDGGTAVEGIWEIPLKSYGGWPMNFVPQSFESFFKRAANSTTITPAVGVSDTLMDEPTYTNLSTFDVAVDQRNDIDLTTVAESRFVSIKHTVSTTGGSFSWQGGILRGESTDLPVGGTY